MCSRDEPHKSRNPPGPSFSSSLLDQIYRSIDANVHASRSSRRHGAGGNQEKETPSFRSACLLEKWMEKEANTRPNFLEDSDFSSTSNSSDDSSGALSSASDTDFFPSAHHESRQKVSCFAPRPKPVLTKPGSTKHDNHNIDDVLIKSKSRALKIYANLKKIKQPISPGGRLTTFINSLFANGKESRKPDHSRGFRDVTSPAGPSACSSVSSFSRSCLSKYSPRTREKLRSGGPRTVRFEPVSVIMDEDLRPCGDKRINKANSDRLENALRELKLNKKVERTVPDSGVEGYSNKKSNIYFNQDEDCLSDTSSDLFELDHLSLFGSDRYSEELPVYETTHFDTNCDIASGLIQ